MPSKSTPKKSALGRGLGSLLGGDPNPAPRHVPIDEITLDEKAQNKTFPKQPTKAAQKAPVASPPPQKSTTPEHLRIWNISIDKVFGNKEQPRKHFDAEALMSLTKSIKEKGILQPITVRKLTPTKFEIIAGERRFRAAQAAGLKEVPAILKDSEDQDTLELALIENIQREDLNVIEEAEAYKHLIDEYGLTQAELSERIGKERVTIANLLRLLKLTPKVRKMVVEGTLSLGQAKLLVSVEDSSLQSIIAKKICNDKLTVRASEKLVQQYLKPKKKTAIDDFDVSARLVGSLSEELQKILGTKVKIDYKKGKGKIGIHFYSDSELNQFADKMKSNWL